MTATRVASGPRARIAQWTSLAAIVASLTHVIIDFVAQIYPRTGWGAALVGLSAASVYGIWVLALGRWSRFGSSGGASASALIALIQAGLANGLAGMFPCPPLALFGLPASCPYALWQDLAHLGSLVFGMAAFWAITTDPEERTARDKRLPRAAGLLLVIHLALAALVAS